MSKKQKTNLTTFYSGTLQVEATPLDDLTLARRLLQRALDENRLPVACLLAVSVSRLIGPVAKWGLEHHELLTTPAAKRVATLLIEHLAAWLETEKIEDSQIVCERITGLAADKIKKDKTE